MTEYTRLEAGAEAPDFTLLNQKGKPVSLSDLAGSKVILYFYPAAATPACTMEAVDFNRALPKFKKAGYTVIGLSPDEPAKLEKFRSNQGLKFDLLSDPDHSVHQAYGAFGEKNLYGRQYVGVIRSTVVLDETGKVTHPLYNVKATGHVGMLLRLLGLEKAPAKKPAEPKA
ncbi:MAG: hypothetical protein RL508_657 [Actinomycetota bacterium]|jgi:peroxiredoxin Q/BCP